MDYKFIWADVGSNGADSDAQNFTDSELEEAIENDVIGFPPADPLPNDDRDINNCYQGIGIDIALNI